GRGLADYREGQFANAVERLRNSLSPGSEVTYLDSMAFLFLAMARQQLGQVEEAQQSLKKARLMMEQKFPKPDRGQLLGHDWADWLRFQIVRREAEILVKAPASVSQK